MDRITKANSVDTSTKGSETILFDIATRVSPALQHYTGRIQLGMKIEQLPRPASPLSARSNAKPLCSTHPPAAARLGTPCCRSAVSSSQGILHGGPCSSGVASVFSLYLRHYTTCPESHRKCDGHEHYRHRERRRPSTAARACLLETFGTP
jgi:hypothetical protein